MSIKKKRSFLSTTKNSTLCKNNISNQKKKNNSFDADTFRGFFL